MFKRVLDIALTLLMCLVAVPLVLLFALVVATDGHSPFYSQNRVGKDGRIFRMWKLRTMVRDADALLHKHLLENPAARLEWQRTQKLKNDPRITRFGSLLRKTSMDELPQLWNVLRGDMSLVGPRPMMVGQRAMYLGSGYYRLRPGISGSWQVSDRNACDFHQRAVYDDQYYRSASFFTDLQILFRTVGVVLRGTGY